MTHFSCHAHEVVTALDIKTIVVNFANIGRHKREGDFAWSNKRLAIAGLHERGMKAVGVVYQRQMISVTD